MEQEKRKSNRILSTFTIITSVIYIVWRIFFTIPFGFGFIAVVSGIILLLAEIGGLLESAVHFYNMSNIVLPEKPEVEEEDFPHVDVFIATCNEPIDLLYKTVNGCINMDYPHKEKIHIYLCDDGNREEVRALAKKMNVGYVTRTEREGAKAGNLNNAMNHSHSPLIVTFDADMIPTSDFLMTTVPYFLGEEKIGFIQLPQNFYNPDLFQYNLYSENRIPNEQDYFYKDIQVAKNKTNSVIYGGSNTVLSRESLNEVGGFYTKVITEDFATGMLIQSKGYRCYALNEIKASGLSPSDLKSLMKQRARWARGCIQTKRKLHIFFRSGLNLKQKLNYITSVNYWYFGIKRLAYIISPILFSVFDIMVVKCNPVQIIIFWLPMYLCTNASLRRLSNNVRTSKWTNIYETILFPALIPAVLLETVGISQKKFAVTRKDKVENERAYQIKLAIPQGILALLSLIGIVSCIRMMFVTGSPGYIIVLFWLVTNLYSVTMALFFLLERKSIRNSERFQIKSSCTIEIEEYGKIQCETYDISEGGISVIMNFPEYICPDKPIKLKLFSEKYNCSFYGEIIQVNEENHKWRYSFKIVKIEEDQYRKLLNIIYDRIPPRANELIDHSIYEDLKVNIEKRSKKTMTFGRKLPRVSLSKEIQGIDEQGNPHKIILLNFNYRYVLIKDLEGKNLDRLLFYVNNEKIKLKHYKDFRVKNSEGSSTEGKELTKGTLYTIENYESLVRNQGFREELFNWIKENKRLDTEKKEKQGSMKKEAEKEDFDEMAML